MSDQSPPAPAEPPAAPAPESAPAKLLRPRPSWQQVLVAVGAFVAVLAIAGIGFAIGRATAVDGDHPGRPGQEQWFDPRPDGPGFLPPQRPDN
jgi:hypothetical protein